MNPYTDFNQRWQCINGWRCMGNYHMSNQVINCMPYDTINWWEISSEVVPSLIYVPFLQLGLTNPVPCTQVAMKSTIGLPNLNDFWMWNNTDRCAQPQNFMPYGVFDDHYDSKLSAWSVPQTPWIDFNQTINNQMFCTKKEINIKHLKDFRYETRVETNEFGKHFTVYICKEGDCNKEFFRTNNLLDHVRMHAGIRPYSCQYCHKEFTQKSNMKKHLKMHLLPNLEQRKRYQCNQCGACYTERYNFMVSKNSFSRNLFKYRNIQKFTLITKKLILTSTKIICF